MSQALVGSIALSTVKRWIDHVLRVVGGWKTDPEKIKRVVIEATKTWRVVEALGGRNGSSKMGARGNDSTAAGKSKERTKKEDRENSNSLAGGVGREGTAESSAPTGSSRKPNKGKSPSNLHMIKWGIGRMAQGFKGRSRQDQTGLGEGGQCLRAVQVGEWRCMSR